MCGIFCIFRKNQAIDGDFFHEALSLLNHRGPDEQHQLLRTHPHAIGFGHTRLSIVGVDSGRQPLIYGDRLTAIVNGEFYDYKEIRASYQKQGYAFKTKTDSEIILPMYLEHGVDCFSKLNGEFAGVIYDQENEKIIAFRDRHGVKPLFFRRTDAGIAFSSEIKSIISYEKCRPEFNLRELKDRLFYMPWDQDASIFKDVYNVKPGHYLIYDIKSQTCTQYRYWQVDYDKRNYTQAPLEDILDTYKATLVKSVERRLVADVPVASYLSGGIDSSVIYGIASQLQGKGLDAFTIAFDDKKYDESILAKKLVKKYGGQQFVLETNDTMLTDGLRDHLWCLEAPNLNLHGVGKHLLSKLVRDNGYKVVLTGEGSDEYNCGYLTNVLDAIAVDPSAFDADTLKGLFEVSKAVFIADGAEDIPCVEKALGGNLSIYSNAVPHLRLMNSMLTPDYRDAQPELKFERYLAKHKIDVTHWDALNISLYYQSLSTFSLVLTALGDRAEMAHSVEARVPFLDNDLVNFITKVHPKYKYYDNTDKYVLRASCRDFVTQEHYDIPKHPYLAPPSKKDSKFSALMNDTFNSQKFRNMNLFDGGKLAELVAKKNNAAAPDPFLDRFLFLILSTGMLNEIFDFS